MNTTTHTTAEDLMAGIDAVGLHTQWVWTGGNCRAIRVQTGPLVEVPHVLITHEWDPFTDDDLSDDLSGQNLALGIYASEEDYDPAMRVDNATSSRQIAEAVGALLIPV